MSQDHVYSDSYKDTYTTDHVVTTEVVHEDVITHHVDPVVQHDVVVHHEPIHEPIVEAKHDVLPVDHEIFGGEHVDCNVSKNMYNTLFFSLLFAMTFALFVIAYMLIWGVLLHMNNNGAEWTFIFFTWAGFAFGGCLAYSFFKLTESIKVRGLFICALLIPMVLYWQYLNWITQKKETVGAGGTDFTGKSIQVFFIYAGATINGILGGVAMGLLWSFQGTYIASYAAKHSFGTQFAIFWGIFPWVYIFLYLLSYWIIGGYNKGQLMNSTSFLQYGPMIGPMGILQNFRCNVFEQQAFTLLNAGPANGATSYTAAYDLGVRTTMDLFKTSYLSSSSTQTYMRFSSSQFFDVLATVNTKCYNDMTATVPNWVKNQNPASNPGNNAQPTATVKLNGWAAAIKWIEDNAVSIGLPANTSDKTIQSMFTGNDKFDSLLLIFIVGACIIWSWLSDPTEREIQKVLNPAHAVKVKEQMHRQQTFISRGRADTMMTTMTAMPDSYMGVLSLDHMRQSVSKTYERMSGETHLFLYFFASGFVFYQLFMWININALLQTTWYTAHIFTLCCIFVGGAWYGYLYDTWNTTKAAHHPEPVEEPIMGMNPRLYTVVFNIFMTMVGQTWLVLYTWITPPDDGPNTWWLYMLAIFLWGSIAGQVCLNQLVVADLMPKRRVDVKLARCYGAHVLTFGLGFLSNVVLFQIFLNSGDDQTRQYTWRVNGIVAFFFLMLSLFSWCGRGKGSYDVHHGGDVMNIHHGADPNFGLTQENLDHLNRLNDVGVSGGHHGML